MPDLLSDYFSDLLGKIKEIDENIIAFGREHNIKLTEIQEQLAANSRANNEAKSATDNCKNHCE